MNKLFEEKDDFWINPVSIDFENFSKKEEGTVAKCIVMFCREKGNWRPFLKQEINLFYRTFFSTFKRKDINLGILESEGLIKTKESKIYITMDFIDKCRQCKI